MKRIIVVCKYFRLLGASEAVAPTLTFLDAHCECTAGWLESQLAQLAADRSVVTCPVIDSIDANTFAFPGNSGGKSVGIFDWSFGFHWGPSNLNFDASQPRPSPAMAGGLFTMDKEFFYHLGSYDEHMEFWGGENVEMSLRVSY